MKELNLGLIFVILGMVLLMTGALFLVVTESDTTVVKVNCYDRNNNLIIGQVCLDEVNESQDLSVAVFMMGMISCFFGVFVLGVESFQ
jgi:hypothetical protein